MDDPCAITSDLPERPRIEHGEPRAYYRPSNDVVNMPRPETFDSDESYYSILFHELTHWTGHGSRLKREGVEHLAAFGGDRYSREELVAEMGSAFLSNVAGIDTDATIENAAAYIQGWLSALRGDKRFIVQAAGKAQKAVDWMIGDAGLDG